MHQRRDSDRLIDGGADIADADLERAEVFMRPAVPPNLGVIGFAIAPPLAERADLPKGLDEPLEFTEGRKDRRGARARQVLEDDAAVALQPRWMTVPKWRTGRKGQQVW